jgi:hypothetical protein
VEVQINLEVKAMAPRGALVILMLMAAACGTSSVAARPSPSPSPTLSAADQAELTQLEARPLKYPTLLAGGKCRPDGVSATTGMYGQDPAYAQGGPHTASSFGDYFDVSVETRPGLEGPLLLRGADLKVANHPVVFLNSINSSRGVYAFGPVFGTDPSFGAQYTLLAIDTSVQNLNLVPINGGSYLEWFWRQGIGRGWSYCVGFQIDGPTFSEDFVANVPPA